jgi:hypothetical protein
MADELSDDLAVAIERSLGMGRLAGYIAAILRGVWGFRLFTYLCLLLLLNAVFTRNVTANETAEFSGSWVLRLGNRPLIVVTLAPASLSGDTGPFAGSLVRPRFSFVSGSDTIFKIKGPDVRYTIIRTEIKESCLVLTTQNPADKSDEDNYRLCLSSKGQGTLGYDIPSIKPWPVTLENIPPAVASDWESRQYSFDDSDISNSEMQQIWEADKKDRQLTYEKIDWSVVVKADTARKEATRKLLAKGSSTQGLTACGATSEVSGGDSARAHDRPESHKSR